jgi:hypothetical protein
MKWLTTKQLEAAANKSPLAAAECSYEHWMQIKTAGAKELRRALNKNLVAANCTFCALCQREGFVGRMRGCNNCPLKKSTRGFLCCCQEYHKADMAMNLWLAKRRTYKDVQKAITPLTKRLRDVVREAKKA